MKAIGKYIIVEAINEEVKTSSGLLMSGEEVNKLRYKKSKVISVVHDRDWETIIYLPIAFIVSYVCYYCICT